MGIRESLIIEPTPLQPQQRWVLNWPSEEPCSICLECAREDRVVYVQLHCRHVFHQLCLVEWIDRSNSCPLCRCPEPRVVGVCLPEAVPVAEGPGPPVDNVAGSGPGRAP